MEILYNKKEHAAQHLEMTHVLAIFFLIVSTNEQQRLLTNDNNEHTEQDVWVFFYDARLITSMDSMDSYF